MRRLFIVFSIMLLSMAFATPDSFSGIGPGRGLPGVDVAAWDTAADNNYYRVSGAGMDNVQNNKGSVMCVACHTRNPGLYTGKKGSGTSNTFLGSHWVTLNFNDTNQGGGYADGKGVRTGANEYMHNGAGTATNWPDADIPSKYGTTGGTSVDNTFTPADSEGEIICESCHNILKNVGVAKLLADGRTNVNSQLCVGCHSDMNAGINREWKYFENPSGVTWTGTQHHRNSMSGYKATYYGGDGTNDTSASSTMYNVVDSMYGTNPQMWAVASSVTTSRVITWNDNTNPLLRVKAARGQIDPMTSDSTNGGLVCTNCHRAHNAASGSGAFILMTSDNTAPKVDLGIAPYGSAIKGGDTIKRMSDLGGRAAAIADTYPLCNGCHQ